MDKKILKFPNVNIIDFKKIDKPMGPGGVDNVDKVFNRPCVAGAVLQSPLSLIN